MSRRDTHAEERTRNLQPGDADAHAVDLAQERHGVTDYPLRAPEEDQRWAVNTVRIWIGILAGLITFITVMLILGALYD